jgi:hypothetical protein
MPLLLLAKSIFGARHALPSRAKSISCAANTILTARGRLRSRTALHYVAAMTVSPHDLRMLHDATLLRLEMDWKDGEASIVFRMADGPRALGVSDVRHLTCPRQHPWGRSVSVNEVRVASPSSDLVRVEIEMQSGDVLTIEGARLGWKS